MVVPHSFGHGSGELCQRKLVDWNGDEAVGCGIPGRPAGERSRRAKGLKGSSESKALGVYLKREDNKSDTKPSVGR